MPPHPRHRAMVGEVIGVFASCLKNSLRGLLDDFYCATIKRHCGLRFPRGSPDCFLWARRASGKEEVQTMNSRIKFLITRAWIVFALVSLASAQSYKVIRMGSLGGRSTVPAGINSADEVTGTAYVHNSGQGQHTHAFLWTSGKGMQDLGTLGGMDSQGFAVNDLGQVVGLSWLQGDANRHAFLWTQTGGMQDLGTLGGAESAALAINRSGQIVGWSYNANKQLDAFLWTKNGGMQDLGNLGFGEASATGITDDGAVTGWSYTQSDFNNHIFLWTVGSGMRDLGKLDGSAATPSAINNKRTIVGYFFLKSNQSQH